MPRHQRFSQRLMETITGHSTFLFRPPYNADSQPHTQAEVVPLQIAQNLGYLTVSSDIDPEDWARPGVAAIIERVKEQRPWGNTILLHDAGGNRSQTIESLPLIIDYLETRGDRIVPLGELLGTPAAPFMLPVPKSEQSLLRLVGNSGFRILHLLEEFCWAFLIVATILLTLRTLLVELLAHKNLRRAALPADATAFNPPISIVLAAYNEEKVIARTLEALQHSDNQGIIEIIVIDDGSTDRTAAVVEEISGNDRGAGKILWVFHINNATCPAAPWNAPSQYYSGPDVVDVLGFSAYGKLFSDMPWGSPEDVMDSAYQELCRLDPDKPVIAAEWGVGEFPSAGNKAAWITEAFAVFKKKYPRIKAAVYWHERRQNKDETYSNLRIHSSPEALQAYREAVADPYWAGGR